MKLVRDKIPDIIRRSGREPEIRRIAGEELKAALKDKLVEEALELRNAENLYGELADVLDVIDALVERCGLDGQVLQKAREEKLEKAGGFKEGYLLIGHGQKE